MPTLSREVKPDVAPLVSKMLAAAIDELEAVENDIETRLEELKHLKARAKYIGEHVIPEFVEIEHLNHGATLLDGTQITFRMDLKAGVTNDNKAAAHAFLELVGDGHLLKRKITVSYPKDSSEDMKALMHTLERFTQGLSGVEVDSSTELPGPTMISWVKARLAAGEPVPAVFGMYAPWRAVPV